MSSIIQPTKEFVKGNSLPEALAQKKSQLEKHEDLQIVFLGTPEFAVPILDKLIKSSFKPKAVITAPDKAVGRHQELASPPVKAVAQKNNIPLFQPETEEQLREQLIELKPDLILVAAYGKILPKEIIFSPRYGSINVHPSLLPKHRGPSPIQSSILCGDLKTGVTIMLMNEKMDEGPILAQEIVKIEKEENSQTLEQRLSQLGAALLVKTLNQWVILKNMPESAQKLIYPQQQDNTKATYTKLLTKQDGKIIWDKTAEEIECQVRAFSLWPGSHTIFRAAPSPSFSQESKKEKPISLKILKAKVKKFQAGKELGEVFLTDNKELAVQTGKNSLIIEELQAEGGKPMLSNDFLNGHPEIIGAILK